MILIRNDSELAKMTKETLIPGIAGSVAGTKEAREVRDRLANLGVEQEVVPIGEMAVYL